MGQWGVEGSSSGIRGGDWAGLGWGWGGVGEWEEGILSTEPAGLEGGGYLWMSKPRGLAVHPLQAL